MKYLPPDAIKLPGSDRRLYARRVDARGGVWWHVLDGFGEWPFVEEDRACYLESAYQRYTQNQKRPPAHRNVKPTSAHQ